MQKVSFLTILKTKSSEVSSDNFSTKGSTLYIPDFFIILFCVTLFYFSVFMDLFILLYLIFHTTTVAVIMFAISTLPHGICEFLVVRKENYIFCEKGNFSNSAPILAACKILGASFYFLGLGSIFMFTRILIETFQINRMLVKPLPDFPHPVFHISDENLSLIKIFCCINLALKSIPQLFIMSVFILEKYVNEGAAFIFVTNILFNILIFCQTMATTFPLQRTSRVFRSYFCVLLSALSKFMATMCACYLNLAVFAMTFRLISYYAILAHVLKSLIWVWPCQRLLKHQPIPLCKFYFITYMIFICLIFSFIYIHPFEGLGKLYYYFFYLLGFLYELFSIYFFSDANLESVTYYFTLKILMFGFLSCYGVLNILHKFKREEHVHQIATKTEIEMVNIENKQHKQSEQKSDEYFNENQETTMMKK